jgi:ribosomal protein S18 acetylase RimI-like enzyme
MDDYSARWSDELNGVDIHPLDRENLDRVEPLWNALREHHATVAPDLGPPRSREESWRRRRAQYEVWLSEPGSFLLVAERSGEPVGYAMVHLRGGSSTWPLGEQAGEIETLSVLPAARGLGIGTALLAAVHEELRAVGITELSLLVLPGNLSAIGFYERQGFNTFGLWLRVGSAPG